MPSVNTYQRDPYVKCKYYRKESSTDIKCLGVCGTHTINTFVTKADKKEYKADFCNGYMWNCPLYIALEVDHGETE